MPTPTHYALPGWPSSASGGSTSSSNNAGRTLNKPVTDTSVEDFDAILRINARYAASQGAIAQITRVLALEGGKRGIRANSVLPGVIDTDIMEGVVDNGREMLAGFGDAHPIGRIGRPEEVA